MPDLSRQEVEELALLARLHLEPDEIERMRTELGVILDHFAALAAADTAGIPPMTHAVPLDMALRPDVPAPSLAVEHAMEAAPKRYDDMFVVPAIIEPSRPSGGAT